ncbi:carboxypeptidase regulatory-like domain-containing protein [Salmonella enterica]|nr:carboxypeptidase regulatory-like domain-containing protein [Salmonella enterica]
MVTTILSGTLTDRSGALLTMTTITLTETDSRNTLITTTDTAGHYRLTVPEGTWRVTLQPPDSAPKVAGVLSVGAGAPSSSLDSLISDLQPSTLDIQVLGFMRGLVDEAERAAETIKTSRDDIAKDREETLTAAQEAKVAAEQASRNASSGGDGLQGEPGKDGQSAMDIWTAQQPAGSDTSLAAFMQYMAGKKGDKGDPGPKGDRGDPGTGADVDLSGLKACRVARPLNRGENLSELYGPDNEGIYYVDDPTDLDPGDIPAPEPGQIQVISTGGQEAQIYTSWKGHIWIRCRGRDGYPYGVPYGWKQVGTAEYRFLACDSRVYTGTLMSGSSLAPPQSGAWEAGGDAAAGEKTLWSRVR